MILTNEIKGVIYIVLSGLFYGFLGYFGTHSLEYSGSIANMLFWRFLIAVLFIGLFLLPQLAKMQFHIPAMLSIFSASAIFYAGGTAAFFAASQYIGTGIAMVIFFTYPAIIILTNWLIYRQPIHRSYIIAVALILIGLLFLIELKLGFSIPGIILSLISACGYAFYIMTSKKNNILHPVLASWLVCAGCCVFCLVFALFNHAFFLPTTLDFWYHSLGLGILSTAVPILLLLQGLKYISSEKAGILGVLEPIFVALIGVLLLGETLRFIQVFGIVIVLSGALLSLLNQKSAIDTK